MKGYKEITIDLKSAPNRRDKMAIRELNSFFNPDDFTIYLNGQKMTLYLRALDVQEFVLVKNTVEADMGSETHSLLASIEQSILNIKNYGIKNGKRVFIDFNNERKVKDRVVKEGRRGKYFYAVNHKYIDQNTQLPDTFQNQIICGDSQKVLEKLPNNCVDMVFTSPPYNFGLDYEDGEDDHNWDLYFKRLFRILDECIRVLKYGGRLIINVQPLFSDYIPSHHMISQHLMRRKLIWKGEVLWEKNNYNCKYTAWGSWKSPSNPYLKYTWEFIEIFCKGEMKKPGDKELIDISAEEFKEWVVAKWSVAPERKMKKYDHPAMFPEKLVERVLKLFSYKEDIILDPFNGAGTTTSVANKLERRYLGIDTSEQYCETARSRLE
ncbi:MAG: site-specific DNA-methyltransferase [Candidatus Marinimicrobia bacterium]|jgi:DNA modification methylase|nr:DNA methylase [Candidatus Neomarinimicrobiota bacterium]MDP6499366.1 site-specific DNA-methyltransferase [Candidatus Neomarinimicrobiota bacterium]MDP6612209.1 site-specific DNA-methyltransferase [Candidatus Neomarinimicrobiota bacterium]MDP6725932.1 site-specific DNA-methyltransferase [Candidatus Neomarinimicrobiota bacterium]|tara:strand:- start:2291 stop:3430 length:1140 start_codon:yes stop_codon:yes gene_type:complete